MQADTKGSRPLSNPILSSSRPSRFPMLVTSSKVTWDEMERSCNFHVRRTPNQVEPVGAPKRPTNQLVEFKEPRHDTDRELQFSQPSHIHTLVQQLR
jgi:hypothetical protein